MPCNYACACIEKAGKSLYHFIKNYFEADMYRVAYAECINPILDIELNQSTSNEIQILSSITKTHPGRPKKKRRAS